MRGMGAVLGGQTAQRPHVPAPSIVHARVPTSLLGRHDSLLEKEETVGVSFNEEALLDLFFLLGSHLLPLSNSLVACYYLSHSAPVSALMRRAPSVCCAPMSVRVDPHLLYGHVGRAHDGLAQIVKAVVDVVGYRVLRRHAAYNSCKLDADFSLFASC